MACAFNRITTVTLLLEKGIDPLIQDNEGVTALHDSAGKGYLPIIQEMVQYCENLDMQDHTGYTPLHYAVANGHTQCAELLFHRYNQRLLHK